MQGAGQAKRSRKTSLAVGNDGDRSPPRWRITEAHGETVGIKGETARALGRARTSGLVATTPAPGSTLAAKLPGDAGVVLEVERKREVDGHVATRLDEGGSDLAQLLEGSDGIGKPGPRQGDQVLDKGKLPGTAERRLEEGESSWLVVERILDGREPVAGDIVEEGAPCEHVGKAGGVHGSAGHARVRQAHVDGQGEGREGIGGDGKHFEVADDGGRTEVLEAALPILALGAAKHALDVQQAGRQLDASINGGADDGDSGVVAEHDALPAPAVPVEEGIGAGEHLGREGASGGEEAVALDRWRADLLVAPLAGHLAEGVLDVAEGAHLLGEQIAHAAGTRNGRR